MNVKDGARAGIWSTIDIGSRQAVQFMVSVILARLLMPSDFGIIALLTFFSSFASVFVQGGLTVALVQRRETSAAEESAVFWCNLLESIVFGACFIAIAPAVATFYGYPVLRPLMWIATIQIVISALSAVQSALLTRELKLATLAKVGVISSVVSGAGGIISALLGLGVWALAIQMTLSVGMNSSLLWWASPWRPTLRFRIADLHGLFGFGLWVGMSNLLEVFYTQGAALFIGKLYGIGELGLYNRALNTQQLPTGILSAIIGRIALPIFSARADDPAALRRGLRMALALVMLLNLPLMVGVCLLPDLIIEVLFGAKWMPAAPILAILAWLGVTFPMHLLNIQVVLAQGRSRTFFSLELVKRASGIMAILLGISHGIFGLAIAQVLFTVIALFLNVEPIRRSLQYGVIAQVRDLTGIILATAVMAAIVLFLRELLHAAPLPKLALLAFVGGTTYFAFGFLCRIEPFLEGARLVRLLYTSRSTEVRL